MSKNPLFGRNRLKLGTFCTNGNTNASTLVPEAYRATWPLTVKVAQMADSAGFEAMVPYARWKGFVPNKPDHSSHRVLDAFTWAAGIAQATKHAAVFATSHAPTIHPIVAAKQSATIDIISGGRFGLNVVGGWNKPELEMFGAPFREHEQRYDQLAEWTLIVEKLWAAEEEFDFEGEFYKIVGGISRPKPLQTPRPPIMNAGGSEKGREFACRNADMCFSVIKSEDPESIRAEVDAYKALARDFGRTIQVWTNAFVVQRDTQEEAEAYLRHYSVDNADREVLEAVFPLRVGNSRFLPPEMYDAFRMRLAGGGGGFPLVGSAERIAERLAMLSACGVDGVLMTWVDYVDGLPRFIGGVLPLLERAGLRDPFTPQSAPLAGQENLPAGA